MYKACACPVAEVQEDPAHPGHYRGVVCGRIYGEPSLLDAELTTLGYVEVDDDQWGTSYRHRRQRAYRAELDESPDETGLLRLEVRAEDLTEQQAAEACDELERLFAALAGRYSLTGARDCCSCVSAGCGPDRQLAKPAAGR
ncbi:MAG: hypothetical protein NTU91_14280 [Chloroflexi bacterium]|nr:hypothetical protein [Chloroflexota bacterium]